MFFCDFINRRGSLCKYGSLPLQFYHSVPYCLTPLLFLSVSLSRYKLKFSPDKVDTMIVQAISLLDDLDKELNNYMMRAREWYGWHFPELGKIVTDNLAFAKVVKAMGEWQIIESVLFGEVALN